MNLYSAQRLELWGGVECTANRVHDRFQSQLRRSGHWERLEDLDRIASLGIRTLRYPLLWEELAPNDPLEVNWAWADERMARLRALGIRPIVGLVHHGSGPRYTSLVDPGFPRKLAAYARMVAERYPWVDAWTPVNEPLTTARFSGLYGHWHPHGRDLATFARTLQNQLQGVVLAMRAIREIIPEAQLVQTEDLGETTATAQLEYQAIFENERRWLTYDLLCGTLERGGPIEGYLKMAGLTVQELEGYREQPCPPYLLGINHYVTSSRYLDEDVTKYPVAQHGGNGRDCYVDCEAVRARTEGIPEPSRLFTAAWERYQLPIAITEAHLGCSREEQIRWFGEMWRAAEASRAKGAHVAAVTAWSLLGAFDWDTLLTSTRGSYEPGAWDLRSVPPRATALAGLYRELATSSEAQSHLLRSPGWWRRSVRFLPSGPCGRGSGHSDPVYPAFLPRPFTAGGSGRMLLITGARGTLGQAFARLCYLRGLPYRLLTRAEMDIADPESVRTAMHTFRPWAIVNAAGYVRVDDAEQDRYSCLRGNALGPAVLAGECAKRDVRLLTFSSDLVFDGAKGKPYVETDAVTPLNLYGISKAAAESRVSIALPEALIIRTSAFFGPWDDWNVITQLLQRLRDDEQGSAIDDATISPTYVPDLVHAALDLLLDGEHGLWHLANAGETTWAEFGRCAAAIAGFSPSRVQGISSNSLGLPASRPNYSALGSERGALMPPWEDALRRYVDATRHLWELEQSGVA